MANLKKIYGAVSEYAALYALEEFREKWDGKYPQIYKMWEANWADLSAFFKFPDELRRLIYTTNAVEGFHRMLRACLKKVIAHNADMWYDLTKYYIRRKRCADMSLQMPSGKA